MLNASDIHIIPLRKEAFIRFRIDGQLMTPRLITASFARRLVSHFKFMANMDIGERRRPQNGSMHLSVRGSLMHLRLSTLPTPFQECLAIRILPQDERFSLFELSLFPDAPRTLLSLMMRQHGLMVVTGPTGCGKTTTLYALLEAAYQIEERVIVTLEDPIEKISPALIQVEVNEKAGVTYFSGFRSILRHDPDVIMIGEIRDEQTAALAVRAALTGHLVLTTLHTKDAAGCVHRLQELGISKTDLAETVTAVVAQRLVPLKCPFCNERCPRDCGWNPDKRRLAVFEILSDDKLKRLLAGENPDYKTIQDLIYKGIAYGYLDVKMKKRRRAAICEKEKMGKKRKSFVFEKDR